MRWGARNIVDVLDAQRVLYAAVRNYNNARYDYILNSLRLQQTAGTLSPDNLQALSIYLNPNYNPDSDFLPPDLDKEIEANLRRAKPHLADCSLRPSAIDHGALLSLRLQT